MEWQPHEYGLDWIDQDALFECVKNRFAKVMQLTRSNSELPPDPFTVIAQSRVTLTSLDEVLRFEKLRKINKTISNAVGDLHQDILALAPNWQNLGATGGGLDIRTKDGYIHPQFGKPVVAEVKNRFNTIKASDEPKMWDAIKHASQLFGAQGYLFQITPRTPERYDHPWAPSRRTPDESVRVCDGATAYEIVFQRKGALKEIYKALPRIIDNVYEENGRQFLDALPDPRAMEKLYARVFPD